MEDRRTTYSEAELAALEELVESDGWRLLVEDALQEVYDLQAKALENTQNFDQVMFLRGQATKLASFVALKDTIDYYRQEAAEAE